MGPVRRLVRRRIRRSQALEEQEEVLALTDAQRRAQEAYRKRSVKQVAVRFYPAEEDLWAWLSAQENKAGYVKDLIRADMEVRRDA